MEKSYIQDLAIEIKTEGRRTIPLIKSGNIITIHGKNGVGKSMAATLLEIASGNYIFENENRFNNLSRVIERCNIKFYNNGKVLYEVILKPNLWRFDSSLNRVNPLTLGDYFKEENNRLIRINYEDFRKEVHIRTIRGNESLKQQIYFIKDIFVSKIDQKLEKLRNKIEFLKNYQEWLADSGIEQIINNYQKFQSKYNDLLNKINNLDNSIKNRESLLTDFKNALNLLEQLLFISSYKLEDLNNNLKIEQDKIEKIKEDRAKNYKKLNQIEQELKEIREGFDKETRSIINKKNKIKKQIEEFKSQLKSILGTNFRELGIHYNQIEVIKEKINQYNEKIERYKKKIEDLTKENDRIIEINRYLNLLSKLCGEASAGNYGKENIIKIKLNNSSEVKLSFMQLFHIFNENKLEFNQADELKRYKEKVKEYNDEIKKNKEIYNILIKYGKKIQELKELKKKLSNKTSKIDDFTDIDTKIGNLEKQKELLNNKIANLDNDLADCQKEINRLNDNIQKIKESPSESFLITRLNKLKISFDNKHLLKEVCEEKISDIKKKVDEEQKKLNKTKFEKESLSEQVEEIKKKINELGENIKEYLPLFRFKIIGEFIEKFGEYIKKFKKYFENTESLQKKLESLRKDIILVIEGKKPRNKNHLRIISDEFDKVFKELYDKKEFFDYVFKDYKRIKLFDIANKTIIFEDENGIEEARELEEFSSGEKTYAYCRSIISMTANYAKYNIVILDESYALLDNEHSKNLYQFQKEMIQKNAITKFINILPLKENLTDLINVIKKNIEKENDLKNFEIVKSLKSQLEVLQEFENQINKNDYYQEIHYPDELREELHLIFNLHSLIDNNGEEEDDEEEKLEYSFILDGSNIARNNLNSKWGSIKDVLKCRRKLQEYGIPEKNIFIIFGAGLRHHLSPKDKERYNELLKERDINQAPAERDDDWFIIEYAIENNSYIITNDRYLEYRQQSKIYDSFLKSHSIHYTVIGNDIIFDKNFEEVLKRLNIKK
ncbi:MAG: NYN domain-containing protein [Promethearchaeia archaeon]